MSGMGEWLVAASLLVAGFLLAILLNHPVLQVVGWVVGPLTALQGINKLIFGPQHYGIGGPQLVLIGAIGGLGCASAGYLVSKYRIYLCFYLKQMWQATNTATSAAQPHQKREGGNKSSRRPPARASDENRDGDAITRRLLD